MLAAGVEIDTGWLVLAGFCAAAGAALWKLIPWAVSRALGDVIDHQVRPMIAVLSGQVTAVNTRIDSHMESEEDNFESLVNDMGAIRKQLDDRTFTFERLQSTLDERSQLFDGLHATMERTQDVLTTHMAKDEEQFAHSSAALVVGQQSLLDRLAKIEQNTQNATDAVQELQVARKKKNRRRRASDR